MKHYRIITLFVGLLAALSVKAQSPLALTVEDFTIKAGETKTVYVAMQNEGYDVIAIEFKMQLPAGLTLKSKPTLTSERIGSYTDNFGDVVASGKTVNAAKNAAGYWIFSIFSMVDQAPFADTGGNVIAMSIAADADIAIGETTIRLYDIELSTKAAPYYPAEYSNTVSAYHETVSITMAHDRQTFSCAQPLDFTNTGLKAYIATSYSPPIQEAEGPGVGASITLTRVETAVAGTGLFLVGTEGETYQVPYSATAANYDNNLLKPVLIPQVVPQTVGDYTNFLYGQVEGVIAFHKSSGSGTVAAGKAYVQLPTSAVSAARYIGFAFGDETTGITNTRRSSDNLVYDLQGRKIDVNAVVRKGLYILDGKKTVKK